MYNLTKFIGKTYFNDEWKTIIKENIPLTDLKWSKSTRLPYNLLERYEIYSVNGEFSALVDVVRNNKTTTIKSIYVKGE